MKPQTKTQKRRARKKAQPKARESSAEVQCHSLPKYEAFHIVSRLPVELIESILVHLNRESIKSARSALRIFTEVGVAALLSCIILKPTKASVSKLLKLTAYTRGSKPFPHHVKQIVVDLSALWTCESDRDSCDDLGSNEARRAIQRLEWLEKVTVRTVPHTSGPEQLNIHTKTVYLQIVDQFRLRDKPLRAFEIQSGRRRQLSMNLFTTSLSRHGVPTMASKDFSIAKHRLLHQIPTSHLAFRGLEEMTLDLYDHEAHDSWNGDRRMSVGSLPEVLRENAASLKRLRVTLSTPGERPDRFCRDICSFHFASRFWPWGNVHQLVDFARIMPTVHFRKLETVNLMNVQISPREIGDFLSLHGSHLRYLSMNFWSCISVLPKPSTMRALRLYAGSEPNLRLLRLSQVEHQHQSLCIKTLEGSSDLGYWSINAADLELLYAEADLSPRAILFTISYQVGLHIPRATRSQSWGNRVYGATGNHLGEKAQAQERMLRQLQGKDWHGIAKLAKDKLHLAQELLLEIAGRQTPADNGRWSNRGAEEWAADQFLNFEIHEVEGSLGLYTWSKLGWQTPEITVRERYGTVDFDVVFNQRTDVLNATCEDDYGRRVAPSYMTRKQAITYRGGYLEGDYDFDYFRRIDGYE